MKNTKYIILITLVLTGLSFYSCESLLETEDSNTYDINDIKSSVTFAEGVLLTAYNILPRSHNNFPLSNGSDDAVTNDQGNSVKSVIAGGWTSISNPFSTWNAAYEGILYINTFLEEMTDVEWWWKDPSIDSLYAQRLMGEAYGLRAWYYFAILQAHAGLGTNGEMLGVPIVDHVLDAGNPDDYEIPRSTFNQLVQFIVSDCDKAIANLPDRYENTGTYTYDEALGEQYTNRINGLAVRLIKTKTLLYAASPAYSDGTYTNQQAAEAAAAIMDLNNGLANVNIANQDHLKFYNNNTVATNNLHPEVFWYTYLVTANSWEVNNYPPSLYGNGRTNPTQDLVNAFPMVNGTPVTDEKLNSSNPYSGRDPRLSMYILYNGATIPSGVINTKGGSQDAKGSSDPNTTLTGYYLRKFMNVDNVNLDPSVNSSGTRYYTYSRYTDALLMFAEAANQAGGPDGNVGGYSARQVINAIRNRAGITSTAFVDGLNQDQMTELIKNERRIEMCFEEQRFWDLRRWKMINEMKQAVNGVQVSSDGTTYSYVTVESRNYQDYQIYGPIPYRETQKYKIVQNQGW
ncbi:RagB/SusD family nutrient uptake outer membrane protein [Bacteroidota bacterium]